MKNTQSQRKGESKGFPVHEQQIPRRVASRMEGAVKNVGSKPIKKAPKGRK